MKKLARPADTLIEMDQAKAKVTFVDESDDTAENREIVELVVERSATSQSEDRDLDQLITAFGYDPSEFQPR